MEGSFSRSGEDGRRRGCSRSLFGAERGLNRDLSAAGAGGAAGTGGGSSERGSGVLSPGDGVLELTHAGTERATDLREPLGAEEEQGETEQQNDFHGADVGMAAS